MNIVEHLREKFYLNVSYPEQLHETMREANQAWVAFCALPQEIKDGLGFSNFGGYEEKNPTNHHDHKELFHFTLSKQQMFTDYAATLQPEHAAVLTDLTTKTASVVEGTKEIITSFLDSIATHTTDKTSVADSLSTMDTWVIRYLHYYPTDAPELPTAAPHCDVGGYTLHLFQDYPGLEYFDGKTWHPVNLQDGVTSILPGMDAQYRTKGTINATCHRVVATKETQKNRTLFCGNVWQLARRRPME